ncbi:MAG TPA: histidine phosphatase family protein [Acidimicrobiales bacterium]|jgi:2,3-bisphosphoglycerate-dependent phosphoglycerate mutase|nr:histidine phosphatase family protein [Acidimicrobiales bacterium]
MPAAATTRLVLLRHGRSRADDENVHEGRYDSPLTDVGREQAARLAAHWTGNPFGFGRVLHSPLVRAAETASIVGAALGLAPEPEPLWMEHDNGPLAGLPYEEASRRYPIPGDRSRWDPLTSEGGESLAAFERRASQAVEATLRDRPASILVVAHAGILNAAMRMLTGARDTWFAWDDTAFAELVVEWASGDVHIFGVNRAPHLEDAAT